MSKWNHPIMQRKLWKRWNHNGVKTVLFYIVTANLFIRRPINTLSHFVLQLISCLKHREVVRIADKPRDKGCETFANNAKATTPLSSSFSHSCHFLLFSSFLPFPPLFLIPAISSPFPHSCHFLLFSSCKNDHYSVIKIASEWLLQFQG